MARTLLHSVTSARRRADPGRIPEETGAFRVQVSSEAELSTDGLLSAAEVLEKSGPPSSCQNCSASSGGQGPAWVPGEREGIVIHLVVLSDSAPLKKCVAVCLDEVLVATQHAFGQRSDGGQFQRLLRTLEGALEVTVAVTYKLCGILVASSQVTYRAPNDTRFIVGEAETLGKVNPQGSDDVQNDHKTKRNFILPMDSVVTAVVSTRQD